MHSYRGGGGWGGGLNYYVVPEATSRGRRINTESQLKQSWTVAPAKARLKSFLLVICPIDTIVLVTEVPMLAPITIGMASFTVNTGKKKNRCINHALEYSTRTRVHRPGTNGQLAIRHLNGVSLTGRWWPILVC